MLKAASKSGLSKLIGRSRVAAFRITTQPVEKVLAARFQIIPDTARSLRQGALPWPGPLRTRSQSLGPSFSTGCTLLRNGYPE
jgi:hypothetical protein